MQKSLLALLAVAALLVAGCASGPRDDAAPADPVLEAEREVGEPLSDDGLAPGAADSVNLERIVSLTGELGRTVPGAKPGEGYVETAVKGGYAYLCRSGPDQGLVIFDVRDVEAPKEVGFVKLHAGFEADIEVSDDGHWAFWETQRVFLSVPPVPPATDPGANGVNGIHVVDVSDKANPRWVSYTPVLPDGPHSITYANISGEHYVFASVYAYAYNHDPYLAVPGLQRLEIYRLDQSATPAPALTLVSTYIDEGVRDEAGRTDGERFPHDVSIQVHPLTGQTLAYIAYWDLGVVIVDVSDPANPAKVGQATDFGPAGYGDIHMARPFPTLIDGKLVVVTEPEISGQPDTGYYTFIDASDPTAPKYLSSWKLPGNGTSGNAGGGGPHYFDLAYGRMVTAHYGAGFWVVDAHDAANLLDPKTVAYALPAPATGAALPGPLGALGGGSAFDAWWVDPTHVIGSETSAGLTVFRYTGPDLPVAESATAR